MLETSRCCYTQLETRQFSALSGPAICINPYTVFLKLYWRTRRRWFVESRPRPVRKGGWNTKGCQRNTKGLRTEKYTGDVRAESDANAKSFSRPAREIAA